jgi:hypothetical protein
MTHNNNDNHSTQLPSFLSFFLKSTVPVLPMSSTVTTSLVNPLGNLAYFSQK